MGGSADDLAESLILQCIGCDQAQFFGGRIMFISIQTIRGYKVCGRQTEFYCFFVHFVSEGFGGTTDMLCNSNCSVVMRFQQQGIQ